MTEIEILVEAAKTYYELPGNSCGGPMHITLDDGNVDDKCVEFCRAECEKEQDGFGILICNALLELTERERNTVYCLLSGIPDYDPTEENEDT